MIVPDVNLLVYAYSTGAPEHGRAREWWEDLLNGAEGVALPWATSLGFVRLVTSSRVLDRPMQSGKAIAVVRSWLDRANTEVLNPGPRHLEILARLLEAAGAAGSLTTDAHLAALSIEYQCELHSNDADFQRFPGLRWRNPLSERG